MIDRLEQYILSHIDDESELLKHLDREAHVKLLRPRMLSGHLQGKILKMLCRMMQPRFVLEIGTYTGYSALCLAEGSPDDAVIHTIEIDDELEDFVREQFNSSGLGSKINLHIGDASDIIPYFDIVFDLIFIDADKRHYIDYYDLVLKKIRPGGLIIVDNTLWDGKVLKNPHPTDKQTLGIQQFNDMLARDSRVEKVILPVRDGLTLIWKK